MKRFSKALVLTTLIIGAASTTHAALNMNTHTFISSNDYQYSRYYDSTSLRDGNNRTPFGYMTHNHVFEWGIQYTLPTDQIITGATLTVNNFHNVSDPNNILWLELLDNSSIPGTLLGSDANGIVRKFTENDGYPGSNFWVNGMYQGDHMQILKYENVGAADTDISINIDRKLLTNYLADGVFAIGIDPDCHLSMDALSLVIQTKNGQQPVPEPATMLLFGTGLAGLAGIRSRRRKN